MSHGAAANQIAGALPAGGQLLVLIRLRASDHCALIGRERDRAIGLTGRRVRQTTATVPVARPASLRRLPGAPTLFMTSQPAGE
ncbi:MAG TPA: hypothetical protein DGT23_11805 [Micromonosporaceae bacterium]|nr:hypothetical protein [Micromonosporaceae bacterium]